MRVWLQVVVISLTGLSLGACSAFNRGQSQRTAYGDEALDPPGEEGGGNDVAQDYSGVTELAAAPAEAGEDAETVAYVVQPGDTLMKIAYDHYGDLNAWKRVYLENKSRIKDPNSLIKGTSLTLMRSDSAPGERQGEKYRIAIGDTLGKISNNVYGTIKKWKRIWENNRPMIKDPNKIYAGFTLYYQMTDEDRAEFERLRNMPVPLTQEPSGAPAVPSVPSNETKTARAPSSTPAMPAASGGLPSAAALPAAVPISPIPAPATR
jgi:LysM repeat protein